MADVKARASWYPPEQIEVRPRSGLNCETPTGFAALCGEAPVAEQAGPHRGEPAGLRQGLTLISTGPTFGRRPKTVRQITDVVRLPRMSGGCVYIA